VKSKIFRNVIALSLALAAAVANAGTIAYSTGVQNPWDSTTNDTAMNTVFGAGNWVKSNGYDVSVFNGASFVYLDGGDTSFTAFSDFLTTNSGAIASYVSNGGRLFLNAAPQPQNGHDLNLGFGVTLKYPGTSFSVNVTDAGVAAGLTDGGLPTNFGGFGFALATLTGADFTPLIKDVAGNSVFGAKQYGNGFVAFGTQTPVEFHTGPAAQLFANELSYISTAAVQNTNVVPEPTSVALLGVGLLGFVASRRKTRK
jgi:hypothetical protein